MSKAGFAYPTTIWAEIDQARHPEDPAALKVLDTLLRKYYGPLEEHLMHKFHVDKDQAADWLQSFMWKKILLNNIIGQAQSAKGRFRSFILKALDNFVLGELRKEKREIKTTPVEPELLENYPAQGELRAGFEPGAAKEGEDMSDPFDMTWARTVLSQTLTQMEAECNSDHRGRQVWEVFQLRFLKPYLEGEEPIPYKEMINLLGVHSDTEAGNMLITAKRMFNRHLRSVVAEYVQEEKEVEAELESLKAIFLGGVS